MKKILAGMCALALAVAACDAAPALFFTDTCNNITTNTSLTVTNTLPNKITGKLDGIFIDLSGAASPTVTVSVVSAGGQWTGASRTFLTTNITADTYIAPRTYATTATGALITGEAEQFPLYESTVLVTFKAITVTNVNARAYVFVDENN